MVAYQNESTTHTPECEYIQPLSKARHRPINRDIHYEAGWTDSWQHRRCLHKHRTLIEAAECAMPHSAGWYVFAVENGTPRQLKRREDGVVNKFRFGAKRSTKR
jgi:hypothetical protein